jgi:hypothetical protein
MITWVCIYIYRHFILVEKFNCGLESNDLDRVIKMADTRARAILFPRFQILATVMMCLTAARFMCQEFQSLSVGLTE